MIENVVKSVRRKQTIDDKFIDKLYQDVISLYRLDQIGGTMETKKDFGPLPVTAKLLLGTLALVWICIIAVSLIRTLKNKAKDAKKNAK